MIRSSLPFALALLLCALPLASSDAHAADTPVAASTRPLLHPLFSDGAVLQRDRAIPIWGFANPGDTISV